MRPDTRERYEIPIGSIAAGKQIHLVLWIADKVSNDVEFTWTTSAQHADDNDVEFFPPTDQKVNPRFAFSFASISETQGPTRPTTNPSVTPPAGLGKEAQIANAVDDAGREEPEQNSDENNRKA